MENYSVLLFGKNRVVINDFFIYHEENLECLSSSGYNEDLLNHLKYFKPDAMIYCMQEESEEDMQQIQIVREIYGDDIPLILIGQAKECEDFTVSVGNIAALVLIRPLSVSQIQQKVNTFLRQKRRAQQKIEAAEAAKAAKEAEAIKATETTITAKIVNTAGTANGRKRILVVDDDPLMLKVMKENLRDDYDVATAINGKVALKYLSDRTVDLIFLDYQMPEESGPEIMEKLHQNEATKNIPVVFLTGVKEREKIQKALVLKPSGYLLKPIEYDKLMGTIRSIFHE